MQGVGCLMHQVHLGQHIRQLRVQHDPQLLFHPKDLTQGLPADGETDENGVFSLRTYSNDGVPDGAAAGVYSVTINDYPGAVPEGFTATRLPKRPLDLEATVEVKAEDNDLTIEIP